MHKIVGDKIYLRPMTKDDGDLLWQILSDKDAMYAWEKTFTKSDCEAWLTRHINNYSQNHGYMLVFSKEGDVLLGQAGLLKQDFLPEGELGIGYIFKKEHWHKGYATMAASLLFKYGKTILNATSLCCDIRPENAPSIKVAKRLGMVYSGEIVKVVDGKNMVHHLYKANCHPMEMGYYKHFKGNLYLLSGIAYHSENLEPHCVYIPQYGECKTWIRPKNMWNDIVIREDIAYPRFEFIGKEVNL